jgi:hypothetical protein
MQLCAMCSRRLLFAYTERAHLLTDQKHQKHITRTEIASLCKGVLVSPGGGRKSVSKTLKEEAENTKTWRHKAESVPGLPKGCRPGLPKGCRPGLARAWWLGVRGCKPGLLREGSELNRLGYPYGVVIMVLCVVMALLLLLSWYLYSVVMCRG